MSGLVLRGKFLFGNLLLVLGLAGANGLAQTISFESSSLNGAGLNNPTSLDFGPDGRLYVSQQDGVIKAFTVVRNAANDYQVVATETVNLIKENVQNHNDDGSINATNNRQVTGLLVTGSAANPVLYVSSSDWRIAGGGGGNDVDLDTNSGVISRLTCSGGINADVCQAWDHVDLVRGLPRSEENHSTNGMDLDEVNNILYVMSGGHANKGAPSNNFAGTPEYYLSGALLSVDLDMLESMPIQVDTSTIPETRYVFDLMTLDDPQRANVDGVTDRDSPDYTGVDVGDPFGGNNGLNQAIPEPGGPVQIYSPGYRNAYDVVLTESGDLYTWDNGPNGGWGGQPIIYNSNGIAQGVQLDGAVFDAGAGDYCTNEFSEAGSNTHGDQLHLIGDNYYGGHPAPIRAFPDLSGIIVYEKDSTGAWVQVGPTYALSELLPAGFSLADFPNDPRQCDYQTNDPAKYLEKASASTNGIAEYLGGNFDGLMQGDILGAAFNGNIYRCKPDGFGGLVDLPGSNAGLTNGDCEVLFSGFASTPLDVTTLGDGATYPGTVWVANIGSDNITVFEPADFLICNPDVPTEDSDGDGFTNGDEQDNGTDPCSAASRPDDFDGDGISDLNDPDDDNDGIDDVADPFALDAQNGLDTQVPVNYPFFNTDPGTGLFGIGFTGLMLPQDGPTWRDLFDPGQLAAGGTSGLMTVENVTSGDAFGSGNSQDNAFLFGVDVDTNSPPVQISTRLLTPFFDGQTPQPWQSFGFFIGTGDQDNYLKVVLNHNGGSGGVEVLLEQSGTAISTQYDDADWSNQAILSAGQIDLYLQLDPQAGTAQPQISLDQGATLFDLGDPLTLPAAWLSSNDNQGLAIGIISTSNGPSGDTPSFAATWDFLKVEPAAVTAAGEWVFIDDGLNEVRHEGAFVQAGDKFYLLGGRESQSVRIYDPATGSWSTGASSPILLHHFQAVEIDGLIYVVGAMTGGCCSEPAAPNVYIYDPVADTWTTGPEIPPGRARGGGATVVHDGAIYWISGNTNGHQGPASPAVDRFDPATGTFTPLADIPNPRDHFFAIVVDGSIYAVGGRKSGEMTIFEPTVPEVDVYEIASDTWMTLPASADIPTPRAAAATGLVGNEIIVAGGESGSRADAHPETEAFDLTAETWRSLSDMLTPRHATQAIVSNDGFYVVGGSPNQGGPGGAELDLEALYLFGETAPTGAAMSAGVLDVPAGVDFGSVAAGQQVTETVTLSHSGGDQAIAISDVQLTGSIAFSLGQTFVPFVIPPGGSAQIGVVFDAPEPASGSSSGSEAATLSIIEGDGDSSEIVLTATSRTEPEVLFRVNAGGQEIAPFDAGPAWGADTDVANSQYLANPGSNNISGWPTNSIDPSVPTSAPGVLFETERWDNTTDADGEMQWSFPTGDGEFRVRLYLKNGWDGSNDAGERVFDVAVEGSVPAIYDDLDLSGQFGHRVAVMLPYDVTVADGSLDLEFIHGAANNPTVNAIEILALDPASVNQPPQVEPIADQFSREGDISEVSVAATDSDGPDNLNYVANGLPPGLGIEPTNGQIFGTIASGAAADSPYEVTIIVGDGLDQTQVAFNWFVSAPGDDLVVYRINVGGDQLVAADASAPDWAADNATTPSPFRTSGGNNIFNGDGGSAHAGAIVMTDASIPPSAPAEMFNFERWDAAALPEMAWAFPVSAGAQLEVRLYFAELFGGVTAAGQRVFDVSVEGSVPVVFDDIDQFAIAGAKGAFMRSTTVTMVDDTLDIVFLHDVIENPAVKGIEIIQLGGGSGNTPPTLTNPGEQNSTEGEVINLQITGSDTDVGDTLTYSATGLPPDLAIDPDSGQISGTIATEGSGSAFAEQGGLVVIEMESGDPIPANWPPETTFTGFTGDGYLRYAGPDSFNTPGNDTIEYTVEITNPGTYRFQWRNLIGTGTETTEHNDSWLKIDADSFFGQSGGSTVCPIGLDSSENDCSGGSPNGAGADGWFKVYRSGGSVGSWSWSTNTSDNDAHQIFARFDNPGTYSIQVSGRSAEHVIDRMVLSSDTFSGNATDTSLPESPRAGGAAAGSPYNVTVSVSDGTAAPVQETFTWNVAPLLANTPPVADAGADQVVDEGDPVTLDGSASSDPDTDPLLFTWTQLSGPSVTLSDANDPQPTFTAPEVSFQRELVFELTVDDGTESDTDTVSVFVDDVSTGSGALSDAQFEQILLPVTDGAFYTSVVVGPDDMLYAMNINGDIHRWSINADGTLADDEQVITTINDVETDSRSAIGLEFDPSATAGNLIAWVTHVDGGQSGGEKFSGKITRLSGPDLGSAQDFVTGLPRSTGDHWVNSLAFGPDGDLYVNVGSMTAMGALDGTWNDTETLLSAATLRVDLDSIAAPPVDVQTEAGGSYDPFATGAPVTIFGQGVRNAYDLVWHSNGFLYVPTNGSAPGNTPASDSADICPNGLSYSGPSVPELNGVSEQPDFLFKVEQGGYYGHPNPTMCNYVLNGGNPTSGSDPAEVDEYPVGTDPDADYAGAVLDFAVFGSANSHSPNGVLEYRSSPFGGALQGALLVARFHKSDIVAIRPDTSTGEVIEAASGIAGLTGLSNPLDVTEDPRNGNLYVSETQGAFRITLLRPLGAGVPNVDIDRDELIYSGVQGTAGEIQSVVVVNNGSADLELSGVGLAGTNATDFTITTNPSPMTLQPGDQATIEVQFTPGSGEVGSLEALLEISSSDPDQPVLEVGLFGLSAQGLEGGNEPPLQHVVDTLGFDIDVGGSTLSIGGDPNPIGDEVPTSLFRKPSGDSPVTIEPVARYSPAFELPFGWYEPNGTTPNLNEVGVLSGSANPPEHQTLFPELVSGTMSFDPGAAVFGLYTTSPTHTAFTEDALNTGAGIEPHSARVYPLVDRTGNAIPNSFLVAFEEASNTDYQDYVFVIRNVLPAQPAGSGCAPISPLDCPQVAVNLPYSLSWDGDEGGVGDSTGVGTGLTMIDPPSNGTGYIPGNLVVNAANSTLDISTTAGIQFGPTGNNPNSLDNGLGVAFDADIQTSLLETTLAALPAPPGGFAQGGLWLFLDESHYVKLVALSRDTGGWEIQLNYEQDNLTEEELESAADVAAAGDNVSLALDIDPVNNQVTGLYSINGGAEQMLGPIAVDPALLAGKLLPDGSGPHSFGGIFATQRNAAQQLFSFDDFALSFTGTAANLPPLVTSPGNQQGLEGDVVSLQIAASDPDGDDAALSYAASGLPDGLSIDPASGLISGTIAAGTSVDSPFAVTVSVSDAADSTDVNFNWVISEPGDINSGLLLHWPFDEAAGAVAADISGNNNDGVVSASGASFVAGRLGNAIQLDGVAGFVADDDAENYLNGLQQITVTTWVKADGIPTDEGIFTTTAPNNLDEFVALRYDAAGFAGGGTAVIKGGVGNGPTSGNFSILETSSDVQSTDWQHLALVWELGAPAQIYIDGVLNTPSDVNGSMAAAISAVDRLWVGRASKFSNGESGWQGQIDDFRIYGRVLAESEIQQLASGTTTGNTPPGVTNPGEQSSIEGDVISLQIAATDVDAGDVLSYSAGNLPTGLAIDPASGLISGTVAAGAAAGSPFASEVTVDDGSDPVTIQFAWTVNEPVVPIASADVSITPAGGLTATTFNGDAFLITNNGDYPITSVSIDLSTALFADNVFDPVGDAGDAGAKCLTPNSGAAATGFVAPADACVDPFANPHDGGFEILTINFTDFGPGESFGFNTDVDPTSIKNATGTGEAGAVSGLELSGSTVTVSFDDGNGGVGLVGQTFQIAPNSQGGSVAQLRQTAPAAPTLSASGLALADIDLASPAGASGPVSHAAASIANADSAQTIVIDSGSVGDNVRLLQVEAALLAVNGFELEPFEANEAIVVNSQTATTGVDGTVSIPVTLTRTNPTVGGYNYFVAVVDGADGTSRVSNYLILRLENPTGVNQAPVAGNDSVTITAGQQDVMIDLLANDSDADGVLDASSIVIVDPPTQGSLTPGALGVFEYDHTGSLSDRFSYTVDDNEAATSNLATVFIQIPSTPLPDDADGDGTENIADNDDDDDGLLDTEDPFALDADNGLTTDLPLTLPLFSDEPGMGLFGLGFTGLMTNGVIGGTQGTDYLELFDPARVFIDDDLDGTGTLSILNVPDGDAFQDTNNQNDAFQVGLNVDSASQPFVVHTRMLAPFFDDLPPQNFQSQGLFIGTGDQNNYLKMVLDGFENSVELLLEADGIRDADNSGNFGGTFDFLAAETIDLYLVVDTSNIDTIAGAVPIDARVALDDGPIQSIATVNIPLAWLNPDDNFGLAAGLIATSFGAGPEFDATWDTLEAFHLAADDQFAVPEDSATTALDVLANDFDDGMLTIDAVGEPDKGGTAFVNGGVIDYTTVADFSGVETFTYTVSDDAGRTATAVVAVTVEPVNDAPVVTIGGDQSVLEDAGAQSVGDFATGFEPGGGTDEAGQAIVEFLVSNDNPDLFATPPAIATDGTLTYAPAANANGSATVTVQVRDDGGTVNGGDDLSPEQTFVIDVAPVNDAPSITLGGDQSVPEDAGLQSVVGFATGFSPGGGPDEAGQAIAEFVVTNDNSGLFATQPSIDASGALTYTPLVDANGSATVTVQVRDEGGSANGGNDLSPEQTFVIDVTPVNDDPVVIAPIAQSLDEDTGSGELMFAVSDVETAADALSVTASSDNQALIPDGNITLGGSGGNRTIQFTPALDANGGATITLAVDDGSGGSASAGFTVNVAPVNDTPSITLGGDQSVPEDAGLKSVAEFATGFSPGGGPDEAGQAIAEFVVTNDNSGLFATQPSLDVSGTLSYEPAADVTGSATVTVQVRDDGGTANGGNDLSDPQTFTITVTEQADLSITKTADPDPVLTGGTINYTIMVANAGPSTAANVVVTETLPAGVTLQTTSGCAEDPNGAPTCSLGNIAEGGEKTFTVTVEVGTDTLGELVNNVTVTTDTPEADTGNNTASAAVEARQAPALEISPASFDFGSVLITEAASTTLTLTNTGDPITTVTLDAPALAVGSDPAFDITGGDCAAGTELVGGEPGCTVEVAFAPEAVDSSFEATLEVDSNVNAVSATLSGSSELPDWADGFGAADPAGFEQDWNFQAFDAELNAFAPATAAVTGDDYLQIRDPNAIFALGYVGRTFGDTRTSALVNADGLGSGSDSGDGLDNQIDQGVVARYEPTTLSGYAAYMRMELDEQQLVLIKFDGENIDPALIDLRETVATSDDPDWNMGRMYEVELDAADQPDGSVRLIARAFDADSGVLLARREFVDAPAEAFAAGFSGVLAIANSTGLNATFDSASATSSFASAALDPEMVDFGDVPVGFDGQQTVTLTNHGNEPLSIDGLSIAGAAGADYGIADNGCTSPLGAGVSCTFDVTLTAGVAGLREAEVVVGTAASTSPDLIPLSASVFAPEPVIDPAAADLGEVPVGETGVPVPFTVANSGNGVTTLVIESVSVSDGFEVFGGTCAVQTALDGGESCSVEVVFMPQAEGELLGELTIQTDAGSINADLVGLGLAGAMLAITPEQLNFGTVTVGETRMESVNITNTGDFASSLVLGTIGLSGSAAFRIADGSCVAEVTELQGGESCTIEVEFAPGSTGPFQATLSVNSTADSAQTILTGSGSSVAEIQLSPTELDFGAVPVGTASTERFSVSNTGGIASELVLTDLGISGQRFEITGGTCAVGTKLSSQDSCTVEVEFAPLLAGNYAGLLAIESSAGNVQANLAGKGLNEVDLDLSVETPTNPTAGENFTYRVTVRNLNEIGTATGVEIATLLPQGVALADSSGCVDDVAVPACVLGTIEAGASASVSLTLAIASDLSGSIAVVSRVLADQDDPQPENNAVETDLGIKLVADLGAEFVSSVEFIPNTTDQVEIELSFTNSGPSDVAAATIVSDLAPGLTDIEWTCVVDTAGACHAAAGVDNFMADIDLPAKGSVTYLFTARLLEPDQDQQGISLALIVEPEGVSDPDVTNNETEISFRTGIFADGFENATER